mgnify:CR=1 FL=1
MYLAYVAENIIEARIVKDLLAAEKISSRILNENAIGAIGEIPFIQTYPEVWLDKEKDLPSAKQVISLYNNRPKSPDVNCDQCGEPNPSNFEFCWNCGDF